MIKRGRILAIWAEGGVVALRVATHELKKFKEKDKSMGINMYQTNMSMHINPT
jgi:predicted DNA binding CopG/RHH family protein